MQDQHMSQAIRAAYLGTMAGQYPLSVVPPAFAIGALGEPPEDAGPGLTARAVTFARTAARRFRRYLAALWRALPGPWPVKALLIVLAVAEPGPFGELALGAYANAVAVHRARRGRS